MTDIRDSTLLFINPVRGIWPGPIRIYTDILRNGIQLVRLKSAEVLVILFNPYRGIGGLQCSQKYHKNLCLNSQTNPEPELAQPCTKKATKKYHVKMTILPVFLCQPVSRMTQKKVAVHQTPVL